MKNRSPIILNCFSRGGSNILWNILLSHLEVCSPIQETLEIFRLDPRDLRWSGIRAAWLTGQLRFFDQWNLAERPPISLRAKSFIDETLHRWKRKTLQDNEMRYKTQDTLYTTEEVENARLVLKNNNGIIFLSNHFLDMYPQAVFICLLRDPIPLYESHKRHKTPVSISPETFTTFYEKMVGKMQMDSERWENCHILRFEDILRDPVQWIQKIYAWSGLDVSRVSKMRFKAKPHMQADGTHATHYKEGRHYWFSYDAIPQMLEPEVNQYQASRLEPSELGHIRSLTRGIRSQLGYTDA